ncbi:response regulator [Sediminispirochaeta bajacaliforniensis]|uniref:response regulator n=1 Tax=Sediminispirochaeta bajacaliforniensis TaxID=148 RepID=UPI00037D8978|nr:response regulator [Sediminispirochaeta bajacaliforniensis]
MYKVLIVDDEEPVLNSFSYMVEHLADGFTVSGKAHSGFEAISSAHQNHPDLVFMDIGMPGIDGLETIKELQRSYPGMLFVLSTAYERFDLAKKAIPLGVFDYLVKPISRKKFLDTLEQARRHLDLERERNALRLDNVKGSMNSRVWEEKNFLLLATWKGLHRKEWDRYRQLFSIDSDLASMYLIKLTGVEVKERSRLHEEIVRQISLKYQQLSTDYLGKLLVFLPGDLETERLLSVLDTIVKRSVPQEVRVTTGLGNPHPFDSFFRSCGEALQYVSEDDEEQGVGEDWEVVFELRRQISRAHGLDDVYPSFFRYSENVFRSSPFHVAKARMVAFFTLLLDDLVRSLGGDQPPAFPFEPARDIMALSTKEEWDAWAGRALRAVIEAENPCRERQLPSVLARAVYYIQGNYEKPLQLSDVASFCSVSPSYLSRLFSEHLEASFIDYLTSVRMRVAEELLLENRLPIKEIAYAVGYQDPNYFSRIFRKQKGIPPTSFLQEQKDDEER